MRFHALSVDHKSLSLRDRNTCNMERHALQIVLLAFLLAAAVPCAASEASGSEPEPDFTVTISKEGIRENSQREFSLGPSATLRVVDETGKATLLPAPSAAAESEAGQYSVAYVFENGQCNFEKTVAYKDAFPGYSQQLWVRTGTEAGNEEEGAGNVGNYTFTNPPDEYLSGGVSFCVRFTTSQSTTTTTTTTSTTAGSTKSPGSSSETTGSGEPSTGAGSGLVPLEPSEVIEGDTELEPGAGSEEEKGSLEEAAEAKANDAETVRVVSKAAAESSGSQTGSKQSEYANPSSLSHSSGDETVADQVSKDLNVSASTTSAGSAASSATEKQPATSQSSETTTKLRTPVGTGDKTGTGGEAPSRLRRLSDSTVSEEKYLTIVVHSAASGSTAGTLTLSGAVMALTASLLAIF
ncbi:unnamed protein product [Neospora caninum Liverpool]|uniref:Toxoplasma gondii family A protein n=1 Tax=Neospora caninum (strain Liverpool) TaxID=572307 RepID=F0VE56_NEOCL|nr:uncharacterized protein NCLIV_017910 [Neospora caninum Liverpool]CBZ51999.1 unnamed protein product [Neospora caninum Liverpool]CEL65960.1 TPA: hypothetical protein BN1204_017910 [Neospora caninum Liverpool]|eukprot:XP_003882032.1 uncharacterized protein NCLIV_017910 [Neospora caninum Liverpool]